MMRDTPRHLVVATHNAGKLDEIRSLFADLPVTITSAAELGLPEPAETEDSFVGNARIKAHAAARATGLAALADDSGLCIDALSGAPGVYSADWAEGPNGRDFDQAMRTVYERLLETAQPQPWTAHFSCTLVLAWPDGHDEVFEGIAPGQIIWPGRGNNGHGYDPIFLPRDSDLSFGEMDRWAKNRIGHRGAAFDLLRRRFT